MYNLGVGETNRGTRDGRRDDEHQQRTDDQPGPESEGDRGGPWRDQGGHGPERGGGGFDPAGRDDREQRGRVSGGNEGGQAAPTTPLAPGSIPRACDFHP